MGTACHIRIQATIEGSQDPYDNQNEEKPIAMYTIAGRSNALCGFTGVISRIFKVSLVN